LLSQLAPPDVNAGVAKVNRRTAFASKHRPL
jgi:hypothetical protein